VKTSKDPEVEEEVVETDQDPGAGGGQDHVEEIDPDPDLDLGQETEGGVDQDLATNVQDRDQNREIDPAIDPEAGTDLNQVIDFDDDVVREGVRVTRHGATLLHINYLMKATLQPSFPQFSSVE